LAKFESRTSFDVELKALVTTNRTHPTPPAPLKKYSFMVRTKKNGNLAQNFSEKFKTLIAEFTRTKFQSEVAIPLYVRIHWESLTSPWPLRTTTRKSQQSAFQNMNRENSNRIVHQIWSRKGNFTQIELHNYIPTRCKKRCVSESFSNFTYKQ